MICSRRLYKGNSYEICLPLKYSGVTGVNIYTDGAVKIPVTPEISGDTLCFEITSEDLDVLADGVLRYELITDSEVSDSNSRFVVKTPDGYSAQTLDNLLEEAYQSGYTAGGEGGFESGYTSGYTDGYESGYSDGRRSKICEGDYPYIPLSFEIISGGTINWTGNDSKTIEYSKDMGATWSSITSTSQGIQIPVEAGDWLEFRGNNINTDIMGSRFSGSTAIFNVCGNIMSILSAEDFESLSGLSRANAFNSFFQGLTGLISAKNLILPATTLSPACYRSMFSECSNLTETPELPATTLATSCYNRMFHRCTSLATAPELPATTLADSCYYQMFYGCTSLTTAPTLPATTLAQNCYYGMFSWCSSLTSAPELPATTLVKGCYHSMFEACQRLRKAPELPATTLTEACYNNMFRYCPFTEIKCYATDISANYCTGNWLEFVPSTGTFYKNPNMTSWTTGASGIPTNWTVVDYTP